MIAEQLKDMDEEDSTMIAAYLHTLSGDDGDPIIAAYLRSLSEDL